MYEVLGPEASEIGQAAKLADVGQLMYEGRVHPFEPFTLGDVEQLINISALVSLGVGPTSKHKLGVYNHKERKDMRKRAEAVNKCFQVHPSPV